MDKWDARFFQRAEQIAEWSQDPSTRVGCVITRDKHVVSEGYNGFPPGIEDDERLHDRDAKLAITLHAELNAIIHAGRSLRGATAYTTLVPCSQCAAALIAAGVVRVVARKPEPTAAERQQRQFRFDVTRDLFKEAGVQLDLV